MQSLNPPRDSAGRYSTYRRNAPKAIALAHSWDDHDDLDQHDQHSGPGAVLELASGEAVSFEQPLPAPVSGTGGDLYDHDQHGRPIQDLQPGTWVVHENNAVRVDVDAHGSETILVATCNTDGAWEISDLAPSASTNQPETHQTTEPQASTPPSPAPTPQGSVPTPPSPAPTPQASRPTRRPAALRVPASHAGHPRSRRRFAEFVLRHGPRTLLTVGEEAGRIANHALPEMR